MTNRRVEGVDEAGVDRALAGPHKRLSSIRHDNDKLNERALRFQIKCDIALKEIIVEL